MKIFFIIALCALLCVTTVSIGVSIFDFGTSKGNDKDHEITLPIPSLSDQLTPVSSDFPIDESTADIPYPETIPPILV